MSFTTVTLLKSNDEKVPVVTHTDLSSVVDKMVLPSWDVEVSQIEGGRGRTNKMGPEVTDPVWLLVENEEDDSVVLQ